MKRSNNKYRLNLIVRALLVPAVFIIATYSSPAAKTDSLKTYNQKSIQVTATKLSNSALSFQSVTSVDSAAITLSGANSLHEAIETVPGVYIKNYGGLGGMKTISMRGSASSQTLIMLDGMPLNSAQNSSVDLSSYPLDLISSIEVAKGGAGAVFGGNALGGAINLLSPQSKTDFAKVKLQAGSFGDRSIMLGGNYNLDNINLGANCIYQSSDGDYPFASNQFGKKVELKRANGDFNNLALSGNFGISGDLSDFSVRAFARQSERGVPGAVVQGHIESPANLDEKDALAIAKYSHVFGDDLIFHSLVAGRFNQMRYRDSTNPGGQTNGTDNTFINKDIFFNSKLTKLIGKASAELTFGANYSLLNGDMLDPSLKSKISRDGAWLGLRYESENWLKWTVAARADYLQTASPFYSALAGVSREIIKNLNLRAFWSRNFRAPNFNEMYYLNYGNSKLKPEQSNSFNLGADAIIFGLVKVSTEGFYIITKDQIVSRPKSAVTWTASNIGLTRNYGAELSASLSYEPIWLKTFNVGYTYQNPTNITVNSAEHGKLITYMPQEIATATAVFEQFGMNLGLIADYSSFRYAYADNTLSGVLPSHLIFNSYLSYSIDLLGTSIHARLSVNNLLDKGYQVILNYPMPGRSFLFTIEAVL